MKVLILGSGGREHALARSIARSPRCERLYVAPGNPGCADIAELVTLDLADLAGITAFCRNAAIDLVIVGPEAPLVAGVADALAAAGIACFGPGRAAAQLEGSKGFTKDFCREFNIPTASYERFSDRAAALEYVRRQGAPIVVKADGLAAGKGVVVAETLVEAEEAVASMFDGAFGAAGAEVVIEEKLEGEEISFFAICDGVHAMPFASAQDHKRVGDGDTGPNTGGMGAYSPAPLMTESLAATTMREIIDPTVAGMAARGLPFRGVLFAGLMIGETGPKLIEFNVRFGDPEAEVILARLDDDLLDILEAAAKGALPNRPPRCSSQTALAVVVAARGYPAAPEKGVPIGGLAEAGAVTGVAVLHAGTRRAGDEILSYGGRVLAVTALGEDIVEARARAYAAIEKLKFPGGFCRRDIGAKALRRIGRE